MSIPKNPETIIIKNKYYPNGISELNIWNYYQKEKPRILNQTRGRDLMFFIVIALNDFIIKRKGYNGNSYIQFTNSNYDKIMNGRITSVHCGMKAYEDICVIDIDSDDFKKAKEATLDVYEAMMKSPFVQTVKIRFTGKTSFHIHCTMVRKIKIKSIKYLVLKLLKDSRLEDKYTISGKRSKGIPNIDLAPLKVNGNFICLNSLSVLGLKCMEVDYDRINTFSPHQAIVKF